MTRIMVFAGLALACGAASASAQAPAAPVPQQPAAAQAPAVRQPERATAPAIAPAAQARAAAAQPTQAAPVLPVTRFSPPPDSTRPAANAAAAAAAQTRVAAPRRYVPAPPAQNATPVNVSMSAMIATTPQPANATMRCKDGTWLTGPAADGRCSANGGTALILPAARTAPAGPARPGRP